MRVVLLVEDDPDTRFMYARFLADAFEVLEAGDGEHALATMQMRIPDVVITDLALPRVDGFELIRRMRQDVRLSEVPVICLSGYGGDTHEQRARDAGCYRFLQKPCLPDTLAQVVVDLLGGR